MCFGKHPAGMNGRRLQVLMVFVFNIIRHPKRHFKKIPVSGMFTKREFTFFCNNIGQVESCCCWVFFLPFLKKTEKSIKENTNTKLGVNYRAFLFPGIPLKGSHLHRHPKKKKKNSSAETKQKIAAVPYFMHFISSL